MATAAHIVQTYGATEEYDDGGGGGGGASAIVYAEPIDEVEVQHEPALPINPYVNTTPYVNLQPGGPPQSADAAASSAERGGAANSAAKSGDVIYSHSGSLSGPAAMAAPPDVQYAKVAKNRAGGAADSGTPASTTAAASSAAADGGGDDASAAIVYAKPIDESKSAAFGEEVDGAVTPSAPSQADAAASAGLSPAARVQRLA